DMHPEHENQGGDADPDVGGGRTGQVLATGLDSGQEGQEERQTSGDQRKTQETPGLAGEAIRRSVGSPVDRDQGVGGNLGPSPGRDGQHPEDDQGTGDQQRTYFHPVSPSSPTPSALIRDARTASSTLRLR